MKSINLTLILLLCILQCRPTYSQIFFKPTTILSSSLRFRGILKNIGLRGAIFADLTDIWNFVSDKFNLGLELNQRRQAHNEIIQKLVNIDSKISALEETIQVVEQKTISAIFKTFPKIVKLEIQLNELSKILNHINFSSDKLREYLSYGLKNSSGINRNKSIYIDEESIEPKFINVSFTNESEMNNLEDEWIIERHTLISFAHVTTGFHENSIQILLSRLEHLILPNPPTRHGLFHQINDLSKFIEVNKFA
ncbi:hypothetical protein Phum_PHUM343640 [Pediculus humanus corporis]|uniref:Uncharacterized protein n=1 Tax=Pediculus humanus subsp. corporis TaxID=121224 RepID=E0VNR4_PEDHC|nr:uncharacterized protein Phum_PHUM343640 [Pediculus humanus corporis]EEB15020.1 hypothetical protein Phum_PHUM343640 [Pediculus humanus corporis]